MLTFANPRYDVITGKKMWKLYTSSDSPAVRDYVGEKLGSRAAAVYVDAMFGVCLFLET